MTTPDTLRAQLSGVIAFPVTPFHDDLSLNLDGLRHNLQALKDAPICAVVAAAGTGEFHTLSPDELRQVIAVTVEELGGYVPVLAATGINTALGVQLAQQAQAAGVDGLLLFPAYYPTADDDALLAYYQTLAAATPLGVLIYSRDSFNPSPGLVQRLADTIPNLIALKDGQGDTRRLQQIMHQVGERLHWIGGAGDDAVPGYYSLGIRTYTSSIANLSPQISRQLHDTAAEGDQGALAALMQRYVLPLYAFRARRKGYEVSVMKRLMDKIGLVGGPVRPPLADLRESEVAELELLATLWRSER
ncbi:dihydrodipicolinate synthase family protein [Armatimonas sp.]|uniref:dihydrodipicolinate synthase family protein n=1 Tax=Armatimonas sp. TaxID=1872638 RepID=UPI00374C8EC5